MQKSRLSSLAPGEGCILGSWELPEAQRDRLEDLGFEPGGAVQCVYEAPAGSPMAFFVKGSLIALRRDDCQHIRIHGEP